ncbi:MAG: phage baseplate assembly protein V, partial [Lachnospiraceae bacterium]|nr:phage baseplate assembly protein V [Lachnospiraceae bacterium]
MVDNKDPESLGRIRVSQDMVSPGSISEWLPIVGQWKKKESGWWTLPELGTQALVVYTKADRSEGYVLGFIYDEKHTVAKRSSEKATGSTILQTKKHRIEVIEEKDKEEIRIESKAGQMRCLINKKGGIQIVNELGDINIKCRNIKIESEKEIYVGSKKTVKAESEDEISVKSKKEVIVESEKEVSLKGKNIKMSGSKGITATNKQIAKQNDKVMGFDTHIMVIPAGMSTANVPLPPPFIGQIKDKVSSDVKIGDKGVATKGSIAKHDDSMHMQLPGTIKFQNNPKKEGEVTGGTVSKVKVNGKEVAVLGSQVTTCNDMGMQNNSTIVSIG